MRTANMLVGIVALSLAVLAAWTPIADVLEAAEPAQAAAQAKPIDKTACARRLAGLKDGNWRAAFAAGCDLADLPPDDGFAILKDSWPKINSVEARQQILKAWHYAMPYPLHARNHPRLLDVLDLGMNDPSPKVQQWAQMFLRQVAFQDFAEDFQAYRAWHKANRGKPPAQVVAESVRRCAAQLAKAQSKEAQKQLLFLTDVQNAFRDIPEVRRAAIQAGLPKILEQAAVAGSSRKASRDSIQTAVQSLELLGQFQLDEADLKRVVVPLMSHDVPIEVQAAAMRALERKEFPWAVDLLIEGLKGGLQQDVSSVSSLVWPAARVLGSIGDPKAIPAMIALIDADNTYDTIYGIGWFGLNPLTGVKYDESHNGAWWREWWEKNKGRYPTAVRAMEIPQLPKRTRSKPARQTDQDPLSDVADVAAADLRAAGDAAQRYFLIGVADKASEPAAGYALLIVLPGGDGSAEFHPFVRRIYKNVLDKRWLVVQPVAPPQVVWPTEATWHLIPQVTTEKFIEDILKDVRAKVKLDPKRIFVLGWSSGGPPCYATALRKGTTVTGAFVAMSVFKPEQMPAVENAKGKAFYLLQSPDDRVTPFRFAEAAEKALLGAGAKVHLQQYDGGHGWHGNVWQMIGDGVAWLEKQVEATP